MRANFVPTAGRHLFGLDSFVIGLGGVGCIFVVVSHFVKVDVVDVWRAVVRVASRTDHRL